MSGLTTAGTIAFDDGFEWTGQWKYDQPVGKR